VATIDITKDVFDGTIADNDVAFVDFWASWCGPYLAFGPVYEQAAERHPEITFAKVDTEDQQELAGYFNIRSIPTLMVFREKILLFNQPGAMPESGLRSLIDQVAAVDMADVRRQIDQDSVEHAQGAAAHTT